MDQDEEWATTFGKREQNYIQTLLNNTQKEKKKKMTSKFCGFLKTDTQPVIELIPCY